MVQPAELPLDRSPLTMERLEAGRVAGHERMQLVSLDPHARRGALTGRKEGASALATAQYRLKGDLKRLDELNAWSPPSWPDDPPAA